jgi:hypothetical protein
MSLIPSAPLTLAFEDEIKLLRDLVIMPLCPASRGDAGFRKALEPSFVIKGGWAERFWTVIF